MLQTEDLRHELSRAECLALLPVAPIGRFVFTDRALPAVVPVNFVLDGERIVVRTRTGSTLASALRGTVVAFQVDDVDPIARTGWTVTVTGRARHVVDEPERGRLAGLPLHSYAGDALDQYLVLPVELVSGLRVGVGPLPHHG